MTAEHGTKGYEILGCDTPNGPGTVIATAVPGTGPRHVVTLPHNYRFVKIVEIDDDRDRTTLDLVPVGSTAAVASDFSTGKKPQRDLRAAALLAKRSRRANRNTTTGPTGVIFTLSAYVNDVETLVESYWEAKGETIEVVNVSSYPEATRKAQVVAAIEDYYSNDGTTHFQFIADGSPSGIPWATNGEYSDIINDDSIPDVVVTRWPIGDSNDLAFAADRMQRYNDRTGYSSAVSAFLSGDLNLNGTFTGEQVLWMIDELREEIQAQEPNQVTMELRESQFQDTESKNATTAALINSYRPELVVLLASGSAAPHPGRFFWSTTGQDSWAMDRLQDGIIVPLVLAASCFTAYDANQHVVANDFLFEEEEGAVAWVGSVTPTWQMINLFLSYYLEQELYENPSRSMADSWLIALQRTKAEFSDLPSHFISVDGYQFLGDPFTPFRPTPQVPQATLSSMVRKTSGNVYAISDTTTIGCPAGDFDDFIVHIQLDGAGVSQSIPAEDITASNVSELDSSIIYVTAVGDSAPSLDGSGDYETTITFHSFGGCYEDSLAVYLNDNLLGYTPTRFRSPDLAITSASGSYGEVDLLDLSAFSEHYPPEPYASCSDFNGDGFVNLVDLTALSFHLNHAIPGGASFAIPYAATSGGTVRLSITDDYPLIGARRVIVDVTLVNAEPYGVLFLSMDNDNPHIAYSSWQKGASYPFVAEGFPIDDHDRHELAVAVFGGEDLGNDINLGRFVLQVDTEQPLVIDDNDFALRYAGLLALASDSGPQQVLAFGQSRFLREVTPPKFTNQLAQNYPNPFNPTTTIAYSLAEPTPVELTVFDVTGARVRTLVNERQVANNYRVHWDGRNNSGDPVASGVYFYRLRAGAFGATKKMIVLK